MSYDDLRPLMTLMTGDEKHDASATSTLDPIWVLYDRFLDVSPVRRSDPGRDYFLLSKGHGPMAFYAVLAEKGFLTRSQLARFGEADSPLGYHPDRMLVPGVEIGSGSLGHGLGLAVGLALGLRAYGLRAQGRASRIATLVGDAELDEGSNAEAIQYAGRRNIGNFLAVVIDNNSASWSWPGGIAARFAVEGWSTDTVSSTDHEALEAAYRRAGARRPHVVVARTS